MNHSNATFPIDKPYKAVCMTSQKWLSPHTDEFICESGKTYLCVSEMPGYSLIGIICNCGTVHYVHSSYLIPLSLN